MMRTLCYLLLIGLFLSCTEYTPKPRGYYRIDLPAPAYRPLPASGLPYFFRVSRLAGVDMPLETTKEQWVNLSYPDLNARIYCTFSPVTRQSFPQAEADSRALLRRTAGQADKIIEKAYENEEKQVYATLYLVEGTSPSPIQFMITDRNSRFFRGALYYDCRPNGDSLAPVTEYLREDVVELIQSFDWKK